MARLQRTRFLGLNTDLPATKLPSGTAIDCLNVSLKNGRLSKRAGFSEFEDDAEATATTTAIVGMWVAKFKTATYIVVKLSTGRLWQRKVSATAADAFTVIANTNGHTHVGGEPGFAFMWADRFIYGDSGGLSQWHPNIPTADAGVMLKAGLPQPTPINIQAAQNGCKDGRYHCHYAFYNNVLDVEGVVSGPCKAAGGPAETRIADGYGGVAFALSVVAPAGYEATHCRVYTTMGNTEYVESGGVGREEFSYRAAIDVQKLLPGTPAMNKGDQALDWSNTFTNEGGILPGCALGCWSGGVGVYANSGGTKGTLSLNGGGVILTAANSGISANDISIIVAVRTPADTSAVPTIATATNGLGGLKVTITVNDASGTTNDTTNQGVVTALANNGTCAAAFTASTASGAGYFTSAMSETYMGGGKESSQDAVYYSKFGRPTMIPQIMSYNQMAAGSDSKEWVDSKSVWPRGDHHVLPSPCNGGVVEVSAAGGTIVLYTATSTWVMRSTPDGKLYAVKRQDGYGCVGHPAAAAMGFESHALAHRAWTITTATTFSDFSTERFATTLEDIPVAYQSASRMAPYSYVDEMWCAVVKSGGTLARRIIVLDKQSGDQVVIYEPAAGMWLSGEGIVAMCELAYAGATPTMLIATNKGRILQYPSGADDDGADFPASWTAVFGTERSAFGQKMELAAIHAGANCAGKVTWTITRRRTDGESLAGDTGLCSADNAINTCGLQSFADGRFWTIKLSSDAADTATAWTVYDIILRLGRTDKQ